jgi:hypothetical protein
MLKQNHQQLNKSPHMELNTQHQSKSSTVEIKPHATQSKSVEAQIK